MDEESTNINKFNFSEFFEKNKFKLIALISIIIISIFGFIILNEFKKNRLIEISDKFNEAKILLNNNKNEKALKNLIYIVNKNVIFYTPSALNLIIEKNLIENKQEKISLFDKVIKGSKLDNETKNLFIIKKIFLIGDDIEEVELLQSLNPIIQSNSIWKNTANDYIKKFYISKKEFKKAKNFSSKN